MTDKPEPPEDPQSASNGVPAEAPAAESEAGEPEANAASSQSGEETATGEARTKSASKDRSSGGKRPPNWPAFILVLVLLAGVGALAYYQWSQGEGSRQAIAALDEQVDEQSSRLADLSRSQENLSRSQEELARALENVEAQVEARLDEEANVAAELRRETRQLEQQLSNLRQQVQAMSTTTTDDWKLAEAYYLTRLAGQRLLTEQDISGALALLQSAEEIVGNHPDPDLYPVRNALADDIAALRTAESVDREGLYLRVDALGQQIDNLQVAEPSNYRPQTDGREPADTAPDDSETSGIWESIQQSFNNALARLTGFVRVTRDDEPLKPLLAPDQQLQARSSVRTALEMAQLALLREQPAVYQTSLAKARRLLSEVYVESAERANLLEELQGLENTDIVQDLPDISGSQQALANYLDQRHQLAPQVDQGDASEQEERETQQ